MKRALRWLCALCVACALVIALATLHGCAATPHQVATSAEVTAGGLTQRLVIENERVYREATDALRNRLAAEHRTLADYDAEARPLDEAFGHRALALSALSAQLYAAAGITDAARAGNPTQIATAARLVVVAIDQLLTAIEDGAILPPVPLPPELDAIRATLRALAGGAP